MRLVKRREFIMFAGGAMAMRLRTAWAQADAMRRIGVLVGSADNSQGQSRVTAFQRALQSLG